MSYQQYIEIKAEKRFGQPCIINTRITVFDILTWLASGMSFNEIIEDYPEINEEHIKAALSFAAEREHVLRIAS
ncbi:DUF433 domain-containing protein [Flavihumibacter sp. ZG627]|uniref:DUF433 domain-containing protein n=1 Tax=Flavihumibacter sp. ZG627 TaxID=1463156 RepID=UPI00057EC844|nr:DUF433 domain-containing protein [Flavihumibacter sp. ZG627]KIC91049.1 hypothetical protein HY58_08540 [Flavihumibacter sp. ZG627]